MIADRGERSGHGHERRAVQRPGDVERRRDPLPGLAAIDLHEGERHRLGSELHARGEAAARQTEREAAQLQRSGRPELGLELGVGGAGAAPGVHSSNAQPVHARRRQHRRQDRPGLQLRRIERRLGHHAPVRIEERGARRRHHHRRIDRLGQRNGLQILLSAFTRGKAGHPQAEIAHDRGAAQQIGGRARRLRVRSGDGDVRPHPDGDVGPCHAQLDSMVVAVALRGFWLERQAVERGGLAQDAGECVVAGPAEMKTEPARHPGQVLQPRHLIGEANRLDDVQSRAAGRRCRPDLLPGLGAQRTRRDRLLRTDRLLVRPDHAGREERDGDRRLAAGEALHQPGQRLERAARPARHVFGRLVGRGLADDLRERSTDSLLLGRQLHLRPAVGHRHQGDAVGRSQAVEEAVRGLAQRPLGADAERVVVDDQDECARVLRLHVRAERRRQRRDRLAPDDGRHVDQVQGRQRPRAAPDLQADLVRLEIGNRTAVAAEGEKVDRDQADAGLERRRRLRRRAAPGGDRAEAGDHHGGERRRRANAAPRPERQGRT
jgi:hypothetical protein